MRAPGRFEANFFRERLLDMVARDLGLDPMDFRRSNLITEAELPFATGKLVPYEGETEFDTGDYHATFQRALDEIGWRAKSRCRANSSKAAITGSPQFRSSKAADRAKKMRGPRSRTTAR